MRTKLKIAFTIALVLAAWAWLLYPTSPEIRVVRVPSPAPGNHPAQSVGSGARPAVTDIDQPLPPEKMPGMLEMWFGPRFASPATVQVVGSLSQEAVEEIADTIRVGKLFRAREDLFHGKLGAAWVSFQFARHSTVKAIHEKDDGSVNVISAVSFPGQPVIHHENAMRGWTANWKGTKAADEASAP